MLLSSKDVNKDELVCVAAAAAVAVTAAIAIL